MAVMRAPYTGVECVVSDAKVGAYEAIGFTVVGDSPARANDGMPGDGATVAEIREYASSRGIALPKSGRKSELLAEIKKGVK